MDAASIVSFLAFVILAIAAFAYQCQIAVEV